MGQGPFVPGSPGARRSPPRPHPDPSHFPSSTYSSYITLSRESLPLGYIESHLDSFPTDAAQALVLITKWVSVISTVTKRSSMLLAQQADACASPVLMMMLREPSWTSQMSGHSLPLAIAQNREGVMVEFAGDGYYGKALYFAAPPRYAHNHGHGTPRADGTIVYQMLICRVFCVAVDNTHEELMQYAKERFLARASSRQQSVNGTQLTIVGRRGFPSGNGTVSPMVKFACESPTLKGCLNYDL